MDGVLVDSESYWVPLENEEILPKVVPDQDVRADEITGMNYREIYDYLDEHYGTAVDREEFLDVFDEAAHEIFGERAALFPVLSDLLAELADREVPVGMVTSSPTSWIDVVFDRFDLHDAFEVVVSADERDFDGKPEPHVYEYAAQLLDVDPVDCVVVEDSSHGIEAAHRAGTFVIGFRFGGDPGDGPADVVIDSPEALRETVLAQVDERA